MPDNINYIRRNSAYFLQNRKESIKSIISEDVSVSSLSSVTGYVQLLEYIGAEGKFQKFYLYAITLPIATILPLFPFIQLFVLFVPDHWCYVDGMEHWNSSELESWKDTFIPVEIGPNGLHRHSQCQMYTSALNKSIIDCPNGWAYDQTDFSKTIPSQFDWVCDREYYSTVVFTVTSLGIVFGTVVFGVLADKFGRRRIFFISLFLLTVPILVTFFIQQYFIPMLMLTFIGWTGYPMVNIIPSMIIAEISNDDFRAWSFSLGWCVIVLGACAAPVISYFGRHWFIIGMASTAPPLLMFLSCFYIPESPSWLISKGRTKDAAKVLRKIASKNGTAGKIANSLELYATLEKIIAAQKLGADKKYEFWTLFKKWRIAKHMILITMVWVMNSLVFDSITLNTPNMPGNQFVNFFILSLVEAPSSFLAVYLLGKVGRRWTQTGSFLICAITAFLAAVLVNYPDFSKVVTVSIYVSRFCVNITTLVIYLQATELLPTPLRSTGCSFASAAGSVASVAAPSIVFAARYQTNIPYLVMGSVSMIGMVASSFIPETLNQPLPETLEEALQFGKGERFWSLKPQRKALSNTASVVSSET